MTARSIQQLTWADINARAAKVARQLQLAYPRRLYGIPRGGIPAAQAVHACMAAQGLTATLTTHPNEADVFIDDIIDSGATRDRFTSKYRGVPFMALVNMQAEDPKGVWYEFPWETMKGEDGPEENIRRVLSFLGEDPDREGLVETPKRVVKSWAQLYSGYSQDPSRLLKTFVDGSCDEMVVLRDIEFYSMCEHHMLPFFGRATIGYIPNGRVVGVSKLARLLEVFARRLQIQERIGEQVTQSLENQLGPKGCGCILTAQHLCMTARGVQKQNSEMVTSSLRGAFLTNSEARSEFLRMAGR